MVQDLDANGTCNAVIHYYGSITGDSIPASEYTLLSHPSFLLMKLKTSSPAKFNES
ncbi:hypothetical protein SAMN05216412_107142 [Nitrosospira multiformis]|uniref:Uncharacterized protein n=1 Tax=Nitrosospira multiformis TaxID=1231 RepID=A0A1I0EYK0_9PROT|nr:hypothetical protein SAMN05216412_107142 [Nitrosospira multiformis]